MLWLHKNLKQGWVSVIIILILSKKCEIVIIESKDSLYMRKRVDIGFFILNVRGAFFLKTISNIFKFVAELFLYLWKIIEYWNCFQMHNNSSRAIELWQRYSVDNYHYLWLGIKSLFPLYIIEYWITFFRKRIGNEEEKVVWPKKISFYAF